VPHSSRPVEAFFNFSSTQFLPFGETMTLEQTARILCEPPLCHPDFERALLLFNFQVEILFPKRPKVASYARLHAAVKFLEHIKNEQGPDELRLVKRFAFPAHAENLKNTIEREGGVLGLGRSWSRRELTDQIDIHWMQARDAARMVSFSHLSLS
jgi:hypothetical protein